MGSALHRDVASQQEDLDALGRAGSGEQHETFDTRADTTAALLR